MKEGENEGRGEGENEGRGEQELGSERKEGWLSPRRRGHSMSTGRCCCCHPRKSWALVDGRGEASSMFKTSVTR
jgi:hypothetical protein